ncbi:putative thioredoxin-disulfide reductase [Medicago truncatula]|uniref:Glutaredoxin n=1 Tax=Medicago truncatula TaxID=3880 RepID=G7J5D7_MEDTR|nr:glutaredoxin [Medicago truncatula]AES71493.1 glutaredoxin C1 [Medicago truncatula]RHN68762.1 putative thioredoxin-disulfide reductase [Medicago truncatula]
MGSILGSQKTQGTKEEMETALNKTKQIAASSPVFVFSKTYCGYCKRVKDLLKQLGATYKVLEMDIESDGDEIHAALTEWTGQRTVPNVFIGGKHIGGCDSILEKHRAGQLIPLLTDAGAIAKNSAQL